MTFRDAWSEAFTEILPIYLAVRVAFLVTTCVAVLFTVPDFSASSVPLSQVWRSWNRWDTGHYSSIAVHGYDAPWRAAFFPLYPLLQRAVTYGTNDPLLSGLLVANLASLLMLAVFYRLVLEDFDRERAHRAVLYLSLFPTSFFFAAAYTESLFLCLVLLSFYNMRHHRWWLAGVFGFFACLTRSAGLFLCFPFCYEYLRARRFALAAVGPDALGGALIPAGTGLFGLYCLARFRDPLAFSHAEAHWQRELHAPWVGTVASIRAIASSGGVLSFQSLRNIIDLGLDLTVLVLIALSCIGPWRFPRSHRAYIWYAVTLYTFLQLFPFDANFPLQSIGRYMLGVFPAFIVLATLGRACTVHLHYMMLAGALLFFLLTQFLTGHWVIG